MCHGLSFPLPASVQRVRSLLPPPPLKCCAGNPCWVEGGLMLDLSSMRR